MDDHECLSIFVRFLLVGFCCDLFPRAPQQSLPLEFSSLKNKHTQPAITSKTGWFLLNSFPNGFLSFHRFFAGSVFLEVGPGGILLTQLEPQRFPASSETSLAGDSWSEKPLACYRRCAEVPGKPGNGILGCGIAPRPFLSCT